MTAPAPPQQIAGQVAAYNQASTASRARIIAAVLAAWAALPQYRDLDMNRFLGIVLPMIAGAQRLQAGLTASYLARLVSTMTGSPAALGALPWDQLTGAALRNGTPPAEVYARPFVQVWTDLSRGQSLTEAVSHGQHRLADLIATDLQLARTHTARVVLSRDPRVVGYRRVPGAKACALCLIVSTQRYHTDRLMPVHPGCQCGIAPIVGTEDPGHVINAALLEQVHNAVREMYGRTNRAAGEIPGTDVAYRDLIIQHEHGEIGPIIGVRGQHFTGPADIPA